jgi:hypothetical protein
MLDVDFKNNIEYRLSNIEPACHRIAQAKQAGNEDIVLHFFTASPHHLFQSTNN